MQIWRFKLSGLKMQKIEMPKEASILCVQTKDGEPCLWAEVNPNAPKEDRVIEVFGTGHDIPCDMGIHRRYIGTFQIGSPLGTLVFHVYERIN
jgi:hypothetical protein